MTACELCGGACCESIVLNVGKPEPDIERWIALHGTRTRLGIRFECACTALKDGQCSIYRDRPKICRDYAVGSNACLTAIAERRPDRKTEIFKAINEASV